MSKKKFVPVIIILTLCLALIGVLAACDKTEKEGVFAQAGIPVQDEYGFWGYVNSAGEEVIAFDYVTATPFDNGVAVVATALSNGTDPGVYYLIDSEGSHIAGPYAYAQLIEGGKYAIVAKKASSAFGSEDSEDKVLFGVYDVAASAMAKDFAYSSISWDKETGVVFAQLNNFTYVWKAEDLSDVGVRIGTAASGGGSQGYAYIWTETAEDDAFNRNVYKIYDKENFDFMSVSGNALLGLGNGWWRISSDASDGNDGTVTNYTYVGEKVVTTFPQSDVTEAQTEDGMLLLTVTNAEGGNEYLLFAANGTQLYSGTQKPDKDSASGGFILAGENGAYTVFVQGVKFSFTLNAQSTFAGGMIYEDMQTEDIYYGYIYSEEAEDGTISGHMAVIAEDGASYAFDASAFGNKSFVGFIGGNVLVGSAGGRCGIADKEGNMLVECIYSELRALDGGYYAAKMGNAWGVIKADGTQLIDFKFADIGV